jgi:hypothetical protein
MLRNIFGKVQRLFSDTYNRTDTWLLCNVWFEASAGITVCSYNFWVVTQHRFSLVHGQRFGTVYLSHLQGSVRTGPWPWRRDEYTVPKCWPWTKEKRCWVTTQSYNHVLCNLLWNMNITFTGPLNWNTLPFCIMEVGKVTFLNILLFTLNT